MEIINFFKCHDHYEARKKEQEYFISLNATLNSIEPMPKPKLKELVIQNKIIKTPYYYCNTCNISCDNIKLFEKHNETTKHKKKVEMDIFSEVLEKIPTNPNLLICEKCNYNTISKKDFNKHLLTPKHKIRINPNIKIPKNPNNGFTCKCNKTYKHLSTLCAHKKLCKIKENIIYDDARNSLWYHEKKCFENDNEESIDTPSENIIVSNHTEDINHLTSLVIEVVKNNSEFQKQMFDMCKNMQSTIMTNCNNTQNNTFNLQVFLNEYCKDAMNISEFVDSFELNISDLESVGRLGYIEGMSTIIINKIKELDVNKRPIHCSDLKREIIYIKDEDKWEREDSNNSKFRKVIKRVSGKNIDMLNDWKEKYPEHEEYESVYNDIYMKLIIATMGGEDLSADENKIMKRVTKHVVIDKKMIL
jgi:hypothetical protein